MLGTAPLNEPDTRVELRALTAELLSRHLPPEKALATDRAGSFDRSLWLRFGEAGLLGLAADEARGGSGGTVGDAVAVTEEIARVLPSLAVDYVLSGMAMRMLAEPDCGAVSAWLPEVAAGRMICSYGLSEPEAGTDLLALRTRAAEVKGEWRVTGQKTWISLAGEADYVFVLCRTDPPQEGRRSRGLSLIAVPTDQPGVTVRRVHLAGMRAAMTCEVFFDDAVAPLENLVGERGRGMRVLSKALDVERVMAAAISLGIARGALDLHIAYAKERTAFGRPIGAFQAIQHPQRTASRNSPRPAPSSNDGSHAGIRPGGARARRDGQAVRGGSGGPHRRPGDARDGRDGARRGIRHADVLPRCPAPAIQPHQQRDGPQRAGRGARPTEELLMFDGIDYVVLPAADIEPLRRLYVDLFGFTEVDVDDQPDPAWQRLWQLPAPPRRSVTLAKPKSAGGWIRLAEVPGLPAPAPAQRPDRVGPYALDFYLRDADAVEQRIERGGWTFRSPAVHYHLPGTTIPVRERMLNQTHSGLLHALVQYRPRGTRCVIDHDPNEDASEVAAAVFLTDRFEEATAFARDVLGGGSTTRAGSTGRRLNRCLAWRLVKAWRSRCSAARISQRPPGVRQSLPRRSAGRAAGPVPRVIASCGMPDLDALRARLAAGDYGQLTGPITVGGVRHLALASHYGAAFVFFQRP